MNKTKFLLLGNLIFGGLAILMWVLRMFNPSIDILIPISISNKNLNASQRRLSFIECEIRSKDLQ